MGRGVAGNTSGDRSLGLGEDGRVRDGGRGASRLSDATRSSLRPATAGHGVD